MNFNELLRANYLWADRMLHKNPNFFTDLSRKNNPSYLLITCSDSRIPVSSIFGLPPGEVFVHRNIANKISKFDINSLSIIQYAVDILKVKYIIVCGHYGCNGIKLSFDSKSHEILSHWLKDIRNLNRKYKKFIDSFLSDQSQNRVDSILSEINTLYQTINIANTRILNEAWQSGRKITIYPFVYSLTTGLIHKISNSGLSSHSGIDKFKRISLNLIKKNSYSIK